MNWLELLKIGGPSCISIVAIYLSYRFSKKQQIFKKSIDKELDEYKGELNKNIETHKGKIQKEVEDLRNLNEKENLLTNRYVNVVTQQRIQWLERLRNDISKLLAVTNSLISERPVVNNFPAIKLINAACEGFFDTKLTTAEQEDKSFDNWVKNLGEKIDKYEEFSRLIVLIELRLNKREDKDLITLLKDLDILVSNSDIKRKEINDVSSKIIIESQRILKAEWEKVKDEVVEGCKSKQLILQEEVI